MNCPSLPYLGVPGIVPVVGVSVFAGQRFRRSSFQISQSSQELMAAVVLAATTHISVTKPQKNKAPSPTNKEVFIAAEIKARSVPHFRTPILGPHFAAAVGRLSAATGTVRSPSRTSPDTRTMVGALTSSATTIGVLP